MPSCNPSAPGYEIMWLIGELMGLSRIAVIAPIAFSLCGTGFAQQPPAKKRVLAIGSVKGFQHDSVSNGLATIWKLGKETGLWDTYIRTDAQLLTKKKLSGNAKNLDYF